ncbi:hypothetical protein, partial [Leyella stercorea]|uniref:hypothetical protein n=1 Tax=Leyella stercorea TaxID=363265 RepID=UPI00266D7F15
MASLPYPRNLLIIWLRGGWLRADGVEVAAWVWQGCHTLLLIHLRRPMQMSAPTDADVCAD